MVTPENTPLGAENARFKGQVLWFEDSNAYPFASAISPSNESGVVVGEPGTVHGSLGLSNGTFYVLGKETEADLEEFSLDYSEGLVGRFWVLPEAICVAFWEFDGRFLPHLAPILTTYNKKIYFSYPEDMGEKWSKVNISSPKNTIPTPKVGIFSITDKQKAFLRKERDKHLRNYHLLTGSKKKKAHFKIKLCNQILAGKLPFDAYEELEWDDEKEAEEIYGSFQYQKKSPLTIRQLSQTSEALKELKSLC